MAEDGGPLPPFSVIAPSNLARSIKLARAARSCPYSTDVPLTGMSLWFGGSNLVSAMHLLPVLTKRSPRVLELGAGTGVVGISAWIAYEGAFSKLSITDGEREVVEQVLRRNVLENGCRAEVECMRWGSALAERAAAVTGEIPFDVILGADLIYGRNCDVHGLMAAAFVRMSSEEYEYRSGNDEDKDIERKDILRQFGVYMEILEGGFKLLCLCLTYPFGIKLSACNTGTVLFSF